MSVGSILIFDRAVFLEKCQLEPYLLMIELFYIFKIRATQEDEPSRKLGKGNSSSSIEWVCRLGSWTGALGDESHPRNIIFIAATAKRGPFQGGLDFL